jgi:glycerol-3-phosphate dehydrogenase (NAD+)
LFFWSAGIAAMVRASTKVAAALCLLQGVVADATSRQLFQTGVAAPRLQGPFLAPRMPVYPQVPAQSMPAVVEQVNPGMVQNFDLLSGAPAYQQEIVVEEDSSSMVGVVAGVAVLAAAAAFLTHRPVAARGAVPVMSLAEEIQDPWQGWTTSDLLEGVAYNGPDLSRASFESVSGSTVAMLGVGGQVAASTKKKKVCIVGSGNWGSTAAKIVGENVLDGLPKEMFEEEVAMWTFEEEVEFAGAKRKISEIINEEHENVKYLPGIRLPKNVKAVPDLKEAVSGASVLVWVLPHQFIPKTAEAVKDILEPDCMSISMVKGGVDIAPDGLELCSESLAKILGHDVSVIMGANVAIEVARDDFCEATIGTSDAKSGEIFQLLFNTPTFSVNVVEEIPSVELCGALKNVVALAAGFTDGLGMGSNTKAAVVRIGLKEMETFIKHFYPETSQEVFLESCGVADLITTCFAGRNRKCAEAFAANRKAGGHRPWEDIETELLDGQKLQGTLTAQEIMPLIKANKLESKLPLMCAIYDIAFNEHQPDTLFKALA